MLAIKKDFPLLIARESEHFTYLDNAATTHKPQVVIDAIQKFYAHDYATVGRSMYTLAEKATEAVVESRATIAQLIGASAQEIVFTSGATESINIIAERWALPRFDKGDVIVLSEQEHHANLLPWLEVARKTGAEVRYIPIYNDGRLNYADLEKIIDEATKLVAVAAISNALGIKNDLTPVITRAHEIGARVLIDASQAVAHESIDVATMQADFLVFSGHKLLGPTGIGVLFIKKTVHDQVEPYRYGGGMVYEADYDRATYMHAPHKFEAGTLPIAQIIGLAAAVRYMQKNVPFNLLREHERILMKALLEGLQRHKKITIYGSLHALQESSIISFSVEGVHAHDVAAYLDRYGIAVRAGHYCAQPLAKKMGIDASVRISIFGYTTLQDITYCLSIIDQLIASIP